MAKQNVTAVHALSFTRILIIANVKEPGFAGFAVEQAGKKYMTPLSTNQVHLQVQVVV